jgi:CHAD domain-containing protein
LRSKLDNGKVAMISPVDENNLASDAQAAVLVPGPKTGLAAWMEQVKVELGRVQQDFDPDAVHDLRVALRRCLSIADIHMALDPLAAWGEMKKEGRRLFKRLGELRDTQVMKEWVGTLVGFQDSAGMKLAAHLDEREAQLWARAKKALGRFNLKKWERWQARLSGVSAPVPLEDPVFQQFALERWQAAHELHRLALRNRSRIAYHRLRIGLKRFRYTVENLLPQRHEAWGKDLKLFQDVLGELHDLFVLWRTALRIGALSDRDVRSQWRARIEEESGARIQTYREKAVGKDSIWPVWRAGLPAGRELEQAAEARIRIWSSFRDPDFARTEDIAGVAMQLFNGLERAGIIATGGMPDVRSALRAAAIMHNVGPPVKGKRGGKASYKQITAAQPPLGLSAETYRLAALAVRYHCGAVHRPASRHMARLTEEQKGAVQLAAAILCLADAFACRGEVRIRHVQVSRMTDAIVISAAGYQEGDPLARKLATARYPLEVVCRAPVMIRTLQE